MKIKTKSELKALADKTFKNYPKAQRLFATLDGNMFLQKNRAELHAGKNSIITFQREDNENTGAKTIKKAAKKAAKKDVKQTEVNEPEEVKSTPKQTTDSKPKNVKEDGTA